jgi:hypothetical protein
MPRATGGSCSEQAGEDTEKTVADTVDDDEIWVTRLRGGLDGATEQDGTYLYMRFYAMSFQAPKKQRGPPGSSGLFSTVVRQRSPRRCDVLPHGCASAGKLQP